MEGKGDWSGKNKPGASSDILSRLQAYNKTSGNP